MRSTTWKAYLGVLCLMASGTANAAKLSFSDKGFIDVGALLQTQFRMIENGSPDKSGPSYDFLFGRARLLVSGQFDEHIGFIFNTDVTYGAATIGGPTGGVAWNNNFYLLDAVGTYKFAKELILDTGLLVLPFSHNELTSGGKYASVTRFSTRPNSPFAPNSNRGLRDMGVQVRGLVLDDRLYYRIGVYNGVQGVANTAVPPLPSNGVNGGDAPAFAGMLRFNIAGKEDGYSFCQVCFASSPIVSIGASGWYQNNAIRPTVPNVPDPTATPPVLPGTSKNIGMHAWTSAGGDLFADIPFGTDLELSADVLFMKYFVGDGAVQSGNDLQALLSLRYGQFGVFGQFEWFDSEAKYVGKGNAIGDLRYYRFGLNYWVLQHIYKVTAEFSIKDAEQAGNTVDGTLIPANQWQFILQFQASF